MIGWLRNMFGSQRDKAINRLRAELTAAQSNIRKIKSSYDAALRNDETLGLWQRADNLSARTANSPEVRKYLRERSRHEVGNGCHARGITRTIANDLVGTGPRLQCQLPDEAANDAIENAWALWDAETQFSEKLHTFVLASVVDGEGVALLTRNPNLLSSVQLDVQVIECDMLATANYGMSRDWRAVDGIEFDEFGNPSIYHILDEHPGDAIGTLKHQRVPAANVLHWYRPDRPQQCRGIPDLTPALLIFGHLREYAAAVLQAARVAACLSALIHTDGSPDDTAAAACPLPFDGMDLEAGMIMALPDGYDVKQLEPSQPTTNYDAYEKAKLREAAHCINVPYNVATGDFSNDSYAGGRMSLQVYQREAKVRRKHLGGRVLDKVFAAWLNQATRIPKLLPPNTPSVAALLPHTWHYDAFPHVDENKAATADTERLNNGTATLAELCAEAGKDWRKVIVQRGKEIALQTKNGSLILPPGTTPPGENAEPKTEEPASVENE